MLAALESYFDQSGFMPHAHCYLWRPAMLWIHASTDTLIGLAYFFISITLYALVRKVKLPFSPMILAFGVFIGACGLTHLMEVWTIWNPDYWVSGAIKGVTAVASVATGVLLVPVRPRVQAVAAAASLAEQRRLQLEEANAQLQKLAERLRHADELKSQFFANVSHELRTPLSLVLGPIERVLGQPGLDPAVRSDLETTRRNARLLLKQVGDLLDASKLDAGKMELEPVATDLSALTRRVGSHFDSLARERRIAFTVETPPELPAELDPDKIEQVLLNLLSNAFKFTPDVGRIRCRLEKGDAGLVLAVEDSGPGIPAHQRELVFERFRQADGAATRRFGGTGLGLAIARDLVSLHGGTLHVEDSPGGGARFVIRLPVFPPAQAPRVPEEVSRAVAARIAGVLEELEVPVSRESEPAGSPGIRPAALVVEDNPDLRGFVSSTLAGTFEVHTAVDGREGLARAEALQPDVVITDLMMPHMSGEDLVHELRARKGTADVPVLVLTARADETMRARLLAGGVQDYLVKPFLADELVARTRNLASSHRARKILGEQLEARSRSVEELAAEVTRRNRELQAALDSARAARAVAERASAVKSTFLNLVSHEFKTPLTSIDLNVDAMLREENEPHQRERLERVARASSRLDALIDSVLEYTRFEAGRPTLSLAEVDPGALAREVVDELLPTARQKLLRLEVHVPPESVTIRTDGRLVRLVLLNLVTNAIKYTDRGSIVLEVAPAEGGTSLRVVDSGRGIPPAEQERVFEPFVQLEEIQSKATPGLGLGLALVRGLVDVLGGRVRLQSTIGSGSTFEVWLPRELP